MAQDDPRHGTWNGYGNLGCRCADCRRANLDHHAATNRAVSKAGTWVRRNHPEVWAALVAAERAALAERESTTRPASAPS